MKIPLGVGDYENDWPEAIWEEFVDIQFQLGYLGQQQLNK